MLVLFMHIRVAQVLNLRSSLAELENPAYANGNIHRL